MEKIMTSIKKDTTKNWEKAVNFIPKDQECIIYTDMLPLGIKIGDGKTKLADLNFFGDASYSFENNTLIIN